MKATRLLVVGLLAVVLAAGPGRAQSEGATRERALFERLRALEQLRESNPEAFRQVVAQKRERLQQAFSQMAPERREQVREVFAGREQARRQQLQNFQSANPQMFQRLMQARGERVRALVQKNPQRFQNFLANHPRLQNWVRQGGSTSVGQMIRQHPGEARQFLQDHPRAREALQGRQAQAGGRPGGGPPAVRSQRPGTQAGGRPQRDTTGRARGGPESGRRRGGGR